MTSAGPFGPLRQFEPVHGEGVMIDADTVYHRVEQVKTQKHGREEAAAIFDTQNTTAQFQAESGEWTLVEPDGRVAARYPEDRIRVSVSWKAFVFDSEAEREAWAQGKAPKSGAPALDVPTALGISSERMVAAGLLTAEETRTLTPTVDGRAAWLARTAEGGQRSIGISEHRRPVSAST